MCLIFFVQVGDWQVLRIQMDRTYTSGTFKLLERYIARKRAGEYARSASAGTSAGEGPLVYYNPSTGETRIDQPQDLSWKALVATAEAFSAFKKRGTAVIASKATGIQHLAPISLKTSAPISNQNVLSAAFSGHFLGTTPSLQASTSSVSVEAIFEPSPTLVAEESNAQNAFMSIVNGHTLEAPVGTGKGSLAIDSDAEVVRAGDSNSFLSKNFSGAGAIRRFGYNNQWLEYEVWIEYR
jgi:hypothetical protein